MPASKNISVLFIEDSRHDAELAQLALERSGYTLQTELVYNHAGVVEALQRRRFDLILADFILPGFSGSQALQEARRLAPQTPFIFLSGVFGEEHAVNMMRSGAVDYVLKQNLGFLPKAVERALGEVNGAAGACRPNRRCARWKCARAWRSMPRGWACGTTSRRAAP